MLRKGIRTKLDATSSTAEALRDALGLESEGEGKGEEMDKKAAKRWAAPLSSTVVSLELAKHMVQVRVHERPFEVEATPEAVKAIIAFCRQRLQDDPIILKRGNAQKRHALPCPSSGLAPWSGVRPRCGFGFGLSLAQWFLPRSRVVPDLHWENHVASLREGLVRALQRRERQDVAEALRRPRPAAQPQLP